MYYFAYGSNMEHQQMLVAGCPGAVFVGAAVLENYCLFFDGFSAPWGGPVANVEVSEGDEVCGGVFKLTEQDLAALDTREGHPRYYARRQVDVLIAGQVQKCPAWIYCREPQPTGTPAKTYIATVIKGARDCGLPEDYIHAEFDHYMRLYR